MSDLMSDADVLRQLLAVARFTANVESQRLKMEFARYWADEMAKPRYADPKRLQQYGFKIYSQNDEDGIIQEIFRRIGTASRTFVEFGVQKGFECNTAKLLVEGWRGLWLEASSKSVGEIRANFQPFLSSGALSVEETRVTAANIDQAIDKAGFADDVDILCIDIDGNDYWVWKGINSIRPRVVVIEYNCSLRPPLSLVIPYNENANWSGGNYFGASLNALVALGLNKGYRIVGCCFAGVNAFFVRDDLCGDHFVQPATAEEHYEPERYFAKFMPSGHTGRPGYFENV
jgi:hypothetical protein